MFSYWNGYFLSLTWWVFLVKVNKVGSGLEVGSSFVCWSFPLTFGGVRHVDLVGANCPASSLGGSGPSFQPCLHLGGRSEAPWRVWVLVLHICAVVSVLSSMRAPSIPSEPADACTLQPPPSREGCFPSLCYFLPSFHDHDLHLGMF